MPQNSPEATVHYSAGFIFLSYLVSLVGCITTLELLHRRTSRRGLYNWYLLVASCVAMGGIGIWSMHFIGNRAIVLNGGEPGEQIVYSLGFTAVSFFLPIIVLMAAFYLIGVLDQGNWYWLAASGLLTGTAVCGMHYVGQFSVSNYNLSYRIANVIGAAIIATMASFIALSVFFKLRDTYTDSWWKRSLCGAVLACAVSGMHWTAAVGTVYHFNGGQGAPRMRTRQQTVIVCAVLSLLACIILLALTLVGNYKKKKSRSQSKQLILACAYFDKHGRIMVTPDGLLPSAKITERYVEKTFAEDELNRNHPSFLWIFQASRNWTALKDLISGMKESLESDPKQRKHYAHGGLLESTDDHPDDDFAVTFKKLFCVAAFNLANSLHESIENLGPLFEEPLETGTLSRRSAFSSTWRSLDLFKKSDIETVSITRHLNGRGKYLFLVSQLSKTDVIKFGSRGYRFATVKQIVDSLAGNIQIPPDRMLRRLERMRMYSSKENLMPPGVHLACFFLRPSIQRSFDVLVPQTSQSQLPYAPFVEVSDKNMEILQEFDEQKVGDIVKALVDQSKQSNPDQSFRWTMYRTFSQLVDRVDDPDIMNATFSTKKITTPCQQLTDESPPMTCTIFSVRLITAVQARSPKPELTWVPLSFFSAQHQLEEAKSPTSDTFARQAQLEFIYLDKSKTAASSNVELRRKSIWEAGHPSTPTSIVRPPLLKHSPEKSRTGNDPPKERLSSTSDATNPDSIMRGGRYDADTLSLDTLRYPVVENSGSFVNSLFSLFKL